MKKFKFSLQTIHNVREMRQEKEEQILSQMQSEANKAAEHIRQIEEMQRRAMENYSQTLRHGEAMNVVDIEMEANHITSLERLKRQAQETLEQKNQLCLRQKNTLAAATREVKVTQKLRETQQKRHRAEIEKREQDALDELVSANFARKMIEQ